MPSSSPVFTSEAEPAINLLPTTLIARQLQGVPSARVRADFLQYLLRLRFFAKSYRYFEISAQLKYHLATLILWPPA